MLTTNGAAVNPRCPRCSPLADYAGACSGVLEAMIDAARKRTFPDPLTLEAARRHLASLRRAAGVKVHYGRRR
jgi:hypothetical protein